ncbi:MAG: LysE family transporter [Gaiellaceae bacterium]|jgi:chemosensory pili system protein ChpE
MKLEIIAMLLALAYCAAPGPVLAEAARQGLKSGFRAALAVELGSLAGDVLWVALTLAGAAALAAASGFRLTASVAGAVFLLWIGIRALRSPRRRHMPQHADPFAERAFATGAAMSVASPYALPFWLGVSSSLSGYGISNNGAFGYTVFSAAFMLTCFAYAVVIAALIAWGRRLLRPRFFHVVDLVCGVVLVVFGLNLLVFALAHAVG